MNQQTKTKKIRTDERGFPLITGKAYIKAMFSGSVYVEIIKGEVPAYSTLVMVKELVPPAEQPDGTFLYFVKLVLYKKGRFVDVVVKYRR